MHSLAVCALKWGAALLVVCQCDALGAQVELKAPPVVAGNENVDGDCGAGSIGGCVCHSVCGRVRMGGGRMKKGHSARGHTQPGS